MADFRNLEVYQISRKLNKEVFLLLRNSQFDRNIRDQLSRASTSIMLNIAEGSGRFSKRDKRNFFVIARASSLECIALFDVIEDLSLCPKEEANTFRIRFEQISKMLFGLIRHLNE